MKKLIKNEIQCLKCLDVIESKFQHDFKRCSCGSCFVDGGLSYNRVGWDSEYGYKDLREWEVIEGVQGASVDTVIIDDLVGVN